MASLQEDSLLAKARLMDMQTLAEVYDSFSPGLYAYSIRLLGDAAQAEECVAETFERFLRALQAGGGPRQYLQAYLYRIAHNWITDQYRRRPLPDLPLESLENSLVGAEDAAAADFLERAHVRAALARLTPDQRQVIMLKFIEGWENEAVAEALGKPVSAVKSLQQRALGALRRMLSKNDVSLEGKHDHSSNA